LRRETGGGTEPSEADVISQRVASQITSQFEEMHNPYDDDAESHSQSSDENMMFLKQWMVINNALPHRLLENAADH